MATENVCDDDIWAVFGSDHESDSPDEHSPPAAMDEQLVASPTVGEGTSKSSSRSDGDERTTTSPPNDNFEVFDSSNDDLLPHRGKGLRALRSFACGDLIFQEAATIRVLNCHAASSLQEAQEMHAHDVQTSFNKLTTAQQTAVMNLSICDKWLLDENQRGESPRLNGIFQTNSFRLNDNDFTGKEQQSYGGLFLQLARINHSCHPNVKHTWRPDLGNVILIHATRNVAIGDELLISYMPRHYNYYESTIDANDNDNAAEMMLQQSSNTTAQTNGEVRRAFLRDEFSFECRCQVCLHDLEEQKQLRIGST